jgi:hypothetical protein
LGIIPAHDPVRELVALHYFGNLYDKDQSEIDFHDHGSSFTRLAREIIHPILPVTDENKKKSVWQVNRMTGEKVWLSTIYYDIYWNCKRSNCSICLNKDINPLPDAFHDITSLDERLRKATLEYLKEMKTNLDILSNLILSAWLLSDLGDYQERSASLHLEERIKELEGLNENLGSLLGSSSSSSDNNNANSENS